MKNRGLKRSMMFVAILIASVSIVKSYQWYMVGENGSTIESLEIEGSILSRKDAKENASNFDNDKDYYYKYYVDISYERGTFPFVIETADTSETELWQRSTRNH